jgi:diaminopimelate decarboxylase
MRGELPGAVAGAVERCARPSLVFDLARLEATMRAVADAARASAITVVFALKSFPHRAVHALAARHFDGFDAASPGELEGLPPARLVSVADPSGRPIVARAGRLIAGCETIEQVRAAPAHAEIAIRLSASLVDRDPAIGAILEGSGRRRSRFGVDVEPARRRETIAAMVAAAAGRPVGLHVHHGAIAATSGERFVATARAALAAAAEADLAPSFLDLGGAWHAVADLAAALRDVRAAVPRAIELVIEPGRLVTEGAGFACGRVTAARELDDRALRVVDLSRICHLRWSTIDLVARPPAGGGRVVLFAGPTCYEEDVLGEWTVADRFDLGDRVVVRDVSGYAVGWNHGFGGLPPAEVVLV